MRRCARRVAEHIAAHQIQRRLRLQRRSIKTNAVLQSCLAIGISALDPEISDLKRQTQKSTNQKPKPNQRVICIASHSIETDAVLQPILPLSHVILQAFWSE